MEVWLDVAEGLALVRPGYRRDEARFGMAQQKARELPARVTGDTDDRDSYAD